MKLKTFRALTADLGDDTEILITVNDTAFNLGPDIGIEGRNVGHGTRPLLLLRLGTGYRLGASS